MRRLRCVKGFKRRRRLSGWAALTGIALPATHTPFGSRHHVRICNSAVAVPHATQRLKALTIRFTHLVALHRINIGCVALARASCVATGTPVLTASRRVSAVTSR